MMNVPTYAYTLRYWVGRRVDGDTYFWGAWDDAHKALEVAESIGGVMMENPNL